MRKLIYTILDEKANAIGPLFVAENDCIARRMLRAAFDKAGDPIIAKYPADFSLIAVGAVMLSNGVTEGFSAPRLVCKMDEIFSEEVR